MQSKPHPNLNDPKNLENSTKQEILEFIKANPSAHLRKIQNSLGCSIATIKHHINNLEREGKIISKQGFYKNYYLFDDFRHNELMNLLNLETPRNLIICMLQHDNVNQSQLSKITHLTHSTISFHMKKLVALGLVKLSYDGKFSIYSIKNKDYVLQILARYSSSTWGSMVNNITNMFASFQDDL